VWCGDGVARGDAGLHGEWAWVGERYAFSTPPHTSPTRTCGLPTSVRLTLGKYVAPFSPPSQVGSLFCSAGCISLLLVVCA